MANLIGFGRVHFLFVYLPDLEELAGIPKQGRRSRAWFG